MLHFEDYLFETNTMWQPKTSEHLVNVTKRLVDKQLEEVLDYDD